VLRIPRPLDEGKNIGDFELAAARAGQSPWAIASTPHLRFGVIDNDEADRHVGGDHLPGRLRTSAARA
jgi:hypothetical protein